MSAVTTWYLNQIVNYPGLLIVIFLCVVAVRNIKAHKKDLKLRLRVLLYAAHILSVQAFVAGILVDTILLLFKQIAPTWNQRTICFVTYIYLTATCAGFLLAVINLFFERLCISFEGTPFKLSKCTRYSFRIMVNLSWTGVGLLYLRYIDPLPYNIYSEQVDSRNGLTCSAHIQGAVDPMVTVTFELIAFLISSSNLFVWAMFMHKLHVLMTDTHADNVRHTSKDFVCLMKEQTMLIGIAVFSSIILWTLQAIFQFGSSLASLDLIVTAAVMFLTFRQLSAYYFSLLKCDKLTVCCCGIFEKYIASRISQEVELSNAMESRIGSQSPPTVEITVASESDKSSHIV
eukprot:803457_1